MKNPETTFKEAVFQDFRTYKANGGKIWAKKIQQVAIVGTPDILIGTGGYLVGLELKATDSDIPTLAQMKDLLDIVQHGGGYGFIACPSNWQWVYSEITALARKRSGISEAARLALLLQSCTQARWSAFPQLSTLLSKLQIG